MANTKETLDLYELALLLNYERASTEPRFRYAKLRETASASSDFKTVLLDVPDWKQASGPKTGFVFDKRTPPVSARDVPDLPSNMLPNPIPANLQGLSEKEVETIYWQARGHDGCYKSITLLQHFFDLYPESTKLRIRTSAGVEFTTTASTRVILEVKLLRPKLLTLSCVLPNQTYITGAGDTMLHAVAGFARLEDENVSIVLDLASMQFGEAGRGLGGRSTFALESLDGFYDRVEKIAFGADTANAKTSLRIGPCPDDVWLKGVARKVKQRWEKRETEPWCGHCGAPGFGGKELRKCSACREVYYCNAAHQAGAWQFHKRFCTARKTAAV